VPNKRTWTDAQLRAAVASSTSYAMVMRFLRLSGCGAGHYNIQQRVKVLGLDTTHFTSTASNRARPCTDDQLRSAVAASTSHSATLGALGLEPAAGIAAKIRRRISVLGLDTSHFTRTRAGRGRGGTRWTDDALRIAVAASKSYAQTLRAVGLIPAGGNYDQIQRRIAELALDTSHFTGMGWNVALRFRPNPSLPLDDVLVAGRPTGSHALKNRLIREGRKQAACELCGWAMRSADGRVPVELDHINGDRTDNRIENLRILCPNCHALQLTHRGLNRRSLRR
jgi:hypothetical protein